MANAHRFAQAWLVLFALASMGTVKAVGRRELLQRRQVKETNAQVQSSFADMPDNVIINEAGASRRELQSTWYPIQSTCSSTSCCGTWQDKARLAGCHPMTANNCNAIECGTALSTYNTPVYCRCRYSSNVYKGYEPYGCVTQRQGNCSGLFNGFAG